MPETSLKEIAKLFNSDAAKLLLDETGLTQPVGSGGFQPKDKQVQAENVPLSVLGQTLNLSATGKGEVQIYPASAQVADLFVDGETFQAPSGTALAELKLDGTVSLGGSFSLSQGALMLSASASASGQLTYQHLLPVRQQSLLLRAFEDLALGTRLPQTVRLDQLVPGEVHRMEALLSLSFGVQARWGKDLDLDKVVSLFNGLSARIQAQAAASVQASLGWSLYEQMRLTVGKANLMNADWVRIRLQRVHEQRLTLGAVVQLQATYDASDIATILQQMLDQSPLPRVVDAFQQVASGNWDAIKGELTNRAVATLDEYLDDTGWKKWLADDPKVKQLVAAANRVVTAYDGLDARVQSLWDQLLGSADLGPDSEIRKVLQQIAGLGTINVTDLIQNQDLKKAIELIESLTGKSLEEILLASDSDARKYLDQAVKLANQALSFLQDAPGTVLSDAKAKIDQYAEKLKIKSTLEFLRTNATSVASLEAAIDAEAQKRLHQLLEKLLDKAFGAISDQDVQKVQQWAQRVLDQYDELNAKLQQVLARFKGEVGFSLSLEMDRLTRREAVIDVEVDPQAPALRDIVPSALLSGSVRDLLDGLPELAVEGQQPSYLIREAALSQRRVRTNSLSFLLSALGLKNVFKNQSQWLEEYNLQFSQQGSGQTAVLARRAAYTGGFLRSNTVGAFDMEAGVWLDVAGQDTPARPFDPYADGALQPKLRLTLALDDSELTTADQAGLDTLLGDLGFLRLISRFPSKLIGGKTVEARLGITMEIDQPGVDSLLSDLNAAGAEESWNLDYLNASRRWYTESLVAEFTNDVSVGDILVAIEQRSDFNQQWTGGADPLTQWAKQVGTFNPTVGNRRPKVDLLRDPDNLNLRARWNPLYSSLFDLASNRKPGLDGLRNIRLGLEDFRNKRSHASLVDLSRAAALGFKDAHPGGLTLSWNNPMFLFWLMIVRLTRLDSKQARAARGLATLRWKDPGDGKPWGDPVVWQLERGAVAPPE